jgi:hypothetical protein
MVGHTKRERMTSMAENIQTAATLQNGEYFKDLIDNVWFKQGEYAYMVTVDVRLPAEVIWVRETIEDELKLVAVMARTMPKKSWRD